ncbi:hypothetical protein D3C81_1273350 [compost metagenome]
MIAAGQLLAIALIRQRLAGLGVHSKDENTSRVGAVHHPQLPVFIKEHIRINDVRMLGSIINGSVSPCLAPHA